MRKPTIKEISEYCGDAEQATLFYYHFESQGWKVGKNPMKNWKSAITGWMKRNKKSGSKVDQALANTDTKLISQFWVRMTQIFGHKWVSSYGAEPCKPWAQVISRLSNDEIAIGLDILINSGAEWPPALTEFHKMCTSKKKPLIAITHAPSKAQIMKKREASKAARLKAMAQMMVIL